MRKGIKSHKYKLAKVASKEQEVSIALSKFMPEGSLPGALIKTICKELDKHVKKPSLLKLDGWQEKSFGQFSDTIPITMLAFAIKLHPIKETFFLLIDKTVAQQFVDVSLGGSGEETPSRKLSDSEKGILEYLVTVVLKSVQKAISGKVNFKFQFEKLIEDPRNLRVYSKADARIVDLNYQMEWKDVDCIVKLIIPNPVINSIFIESPNINQLDSVGRKELKKQFKRYGYINIPITGVVGSTVINARELDKLEVGDALILDESTATFKNDKLSGDLILNICQEESAWKAEMKVKKGKIKCSLKTK